MNAMTILRSLLLACTLSCAGCASIGTRAVGGGYWSGVRCDAANLSDRANIDPSSRLNPAFALVDLPLSFVGDILFLPIDALNEKQKP